MSAASWTELDERGVDDSRPHERLGQVHLPERWERGRIADCPERLDRRLAHVMVVVVEQFLEHRHGLARACGAERGAGERTPPGRPRPRRTESDVDRACFAEQLHDRLPVARRSLAEPVDQQRRGDRPAVPVELRDRVAQPLPVGRRGIRPHRLDDGREARANALRASLLHGEPEPSPVDEGDDRQVEDEEEGRGRGREFAGAADRAAHESGVVPVTPTSLRPSEGRRLLRRRRLPSPALRR